MRYSNRAINIIKKYEGCRTSAYLCPAGIWTIGYGHTNGVKQGDVITEAIADNFLHKDLAETCKTLNRFLENDGIEVTQNQFDALISLAFNIGFRFTRFNLWKQLKAGNFEQSAKEFLDINRANGQVLTGLTKRRREEADLFLRAD